MKKLTVVNDEVNNLKWPNKCSSCGTDLAEEAAIIFNVQTEKAVRALCAGSLSKEPSVNLCYACSRKISGNAYLANFLVKGFGLGFHGADAADRTELEQARGKINMIQVAWILFIIIYLFYFIDYFRPADIGFLLISYLMTEMIKRRLQRISGVKCLRVSKDKRTFWFQNDAFGTAFSELNAHLK